MSGIFDQIINYSPPLIVSGTVNYKGTWNASTNNPTLNSSPAASTKGDYYVVSTAGTQFGITFAIGDWIISNGTAWEKVDLTDAVSSVFGRTGAVVGVSTDYSAVGITNTAIGASNPSTGAFTTVSASTPIAVASGGTGVSTSTGTTNVVLSNSPTIVTPVIAQINDANGNESLVLQALAAATDYIAIRNGKDTQDPPHIYSAGASTNVGMHLQPKGSGLVTISDGTVTDKQLRFSPAGSASSTSTILATSSTVSRTITLPDATGTLLYGGGPLGTPSSGTVTNLTGTASININGTVGATTPSTGAFTTLSASSSISGAVGAYFPSISPAPSGSNLEVGYDSGGNIGVLQAYNRTGSAWRDVGMYGLTSKHFASGSLIGTFSSTGLAVTGALSSTTGANFATSSGNVGIGTTSPAFPLDVNLGMVVRGNATRSGSGMFLANDSTYGLSINAVNHLVAGLPLAIMGYPIKFLSSETGGELARIDTSGNVGIGTTTIQDKLHISGSGTTFVRVGSDTGGSYRGYAFGSTAADAAQYGQLEMELTGGQMRLVAGKSGFGGFLTIHTNGAERARIDTSGNLLVGTTSQIGAEKFGVDSGSGAAGKFKGGSASNANLDTWNPATSGDNIFIAFRTETSETTRGTINYNRGAGLVAYNVTSDYRAKDIFGPVVDSGALIDSVPVYMGKMKGATLERPMFIAHETPAYAHTGEKDAVDAEGKPIYQQIDTSALIPVLWAEIQSLRQRVAALESN
jgi:hypothetical protein